MTSRQKKKKKMQVFFIGILVDDMRAKQLIIKPLKTEVIMSIIRRNDALFDMPALFNDLFTRDMWNWGLNNNSITNTTIPALNIKENEDAYEIEVAAPGMKKDDFKVELDGGMLTISSERKSEDEHKENGKYSRKEFSYQSFQRMLQLPKEVVDSDKIAAKYEDGVLRLSIPKKEEAKPRPPRMIQIS